MIPEPVSDLTFPELAQIYEAYHAKVVRYAAKLLGPDAADDVSQEVFIKIGRSLDTLADPTRLASWVYAVTLNTVRDAARRQAARPDRVSGSGGPEAAARESEDPLSRVADTRSRSPEEAAIRNEMVACYVKHVKRLPRSYYVVYVLSEFEHLSNDEIGRRLSLSLGTVKIRLHRARSKLNEELRRHCRCYHNDRGELMGEPRGR